MSLARLVTAPYRAIDRLYSHGNYRHPVRAAFMDGLDAAVGAVILALGSSAIINYLGARHPIGTQKLLGYNHIPLHFSWGLMVPVVFIGALGFFLSKLAIRASSRELHPEPKRLPLGRRIFALMVALLVAVTAAMLLERSFDPNTALDGIVVFLPALVPAAKRLTAKDAFAYRTPVDSSP